MMGTISIQHYVSETLGNHTKDITKIYQQSGSNPVHVNFLWSNFLSPSEALFFLKRIK